MTDTEEHQVILRRNVENSDTIIHICVNLNIKGSRNFIEKVEIITRNRISDVTDYNHIEVRRKSQRVIKNSRKILQKLIILTFTEFSS